MSEHPGFDLKVFGPVEGWLWPFTAGGEAAARVQPGDNPAQLFTAQLGQTLKAVGRCQLELFGVANRRAQAYLHLPGQMAACRSPADVFEVQAEFWQRALGHYMEASERVAEIAGTMLPRAAARQEQAPADRDYIDFAGPARSGQASGPAKPLRDKNAREPQRRVA